MGKKLNKILEDLVKFHKEWSSSEENKDNALQLEKLLLVLNIFWRNELYDTIMTIYDTRYQRTFKEK